MSKKLLPNGTICGTRNIKDMYCFWNDCREVFSVALKKHGWSNNSTDPAQVEAAFKDLKQLNSSVIAYDTENLKQKFIAEEGWDWHYVVRRRRLYLQRK